MIYEFNFLSKNLDNNMDDDRDENDSEPEGMH